MIHTLSTEVQPGLPYQGILHSVFQRPDSGSGVVIALTSARSGEGVSYVSKRIHSELSSNHGEGTLLVTPQQIISNSWADAHHKPDGPTATDDARKNTWEGWRAKISQLRVRYRYTVIDCPSLSAHSDALSLAPHVDGVVVVVAANETAKPQALNVERQLQMVNAKMLGFVLNKRQYFIPEWLYKRL